MRMKKGKSVIESDDVDNTEEEGDEEELDIKGMLDSMTKSFQAMIRPIQTELKSMKSWQNEVQSKFDNFTQGKDRVSDVDDSDDEEETPAKKVEDVKTPSSSTVKSPQERLLRKQMREMQEQMSAMQQRAAESEKRAVELQQQERLSSRDRKLADSLHSLDGTGVVSVDGGVRYFKDMFQYDEEGGDWFYELRDGTRYSIAETVQKFTPDWLKKPATASGGGGSRPESKNVVKQELNKVKTLRERATNSRNEADVVAYWRGRKEASRKGVSLEELDAS